MAFLEAGVCDRRIRGSCRCVCVSEHLRTKTRSKVRVTTRFVCFAAGRTGLGHGAWFRFCGGQNTFWGVDSESEPRTMKSSTDPRTLPTTGRSSLSSDRSC